MCFYDIHTHKELEYKNSEICIKNISLGESMPDCCFSIGIHPWETKNLSISDFEKYFQNKNCVAIGECGLDALFSDATLEKQEDIFRKHLDFARILKKPVVLHIVKSSNQLFHILKEYDDLTYIWHGFTGNASLIKQFERFNIYFSIGHRGVEKKSTCVDIPINRLLCETDDLQIPVSEIYEKVAAIRSSNLDLLKNEIAKNVKNIFGNELER